MNICGMSERKAKIPVEYYGALDSQRGNDQNLTKTAFPFTLSCHQMAPPAEARSVLDCPSPVCPVESVSNMPAVGSFSVAKATALVEDIAWCTATASRPPSCCLP